MTENTRGTPAALSAHDEATGISTIERVRHRSKRNGPVANPAGVNARSQIEVAFLFATDIAGFKPGMSDMFSEGGA